MAINLGSTAISSLRLGTATPSKVMMGTTQVWPVASVPWTPADLGADLLQWFDFSLTAKVGLNGGSISSVSSAKAGNTDVARMTNASNQPTWRPAAGGRPSSMESPFATGLGFLALVSDQLYTNQAKLCVVAQNISTTTPISGNHEILLAIGDFEANSVSSWITKVWTWDLPRRYTGRLNGSSVTNYQPIPASFEAIWVDEVKPTNATTDRICIGAIRFGAATPGAGGSSNSRIYEVIVTSPTTSLANIERLEGYVAWKPANAALGLVAALPAGHPYKSAAPTK